MIQYYSPAVTRARWSPIQGSVGHAVVTGASSGIGRCIAVLLAERGYTTTLIGLEHDLLWPLARQLCDLAPSEAVAADLSDPQEVERVVEHVSRLPMGVQVLVNCAGYGVYGPFHTQSLNDLSAMMQVNFFAGCRLVYAVLPRMLADDRGHIIQIASMSAHMGAWGLAGYSATKAAQRAFGEAIAEECVGSKVTLSNVYPGIVNTAYFDRPTMRPLWHRVKARAIDPARVARRAVGTIQKPRMNVYVPGHYRLLLQFSSLSADLAMRIVRRGSLPGKLPASLSTGGAARHSDDCRVEELCTTASR